MLPGWKQEPACWIRWLEWRQLTGRRLLSRWWFSSSTTSFAAPRFGAGSSRTGEAHASPTPACTRLLKTANRSIRESEQTRAGLTTICANSSDAVQPSAGRTHPAVPTEAAQKTGSPVATPNRLIPVNRRCRLPAVFALKGPGCDSCMLRGAVCSYSWQSFTNRPPGFWLAATTENRTQSQDACGLIGHRPAILRGRLKAATDLPT